MQNITATIPHKLSRADAKRRIQEAMGEIRRQAAPVVSNVQENWNGDSMAFSANAMGQTISGRVDVEDRAVQLEVALPWMLAALGGAVTGHIEQQCRKLLAAPPAN